MSKAHLLTVTLGIINGGVAATLVHQLWHGTQASVLLATPPRPFGVPELDIEPSPQAASVASIQEEPLFYSSRHFYMPPPPSALPATPPKPDYRLVGTFVIPAKPTMALLTNASGASRKVKAGDDLEGWTVQAVEGARIVLQFENTTFEIAGAVKGTASGMRLVPFAQPSQAVPATGIRTLGSTAQGPSATPATYATATPGSRLYRPPPPK